MYQKFIDPQVLSAIKETMPRDICAMKDKDLGLWCYVFGVSSVPWIRAGWTNPHAADNARRWSSGPALAIQELRELNGLHTMTDRQIAMQHSKGRLRLPRENRFVKPKWLRSRS
jgi:hypothetical protein